MFPYDWSKRDPDGNEHKKVITTGRHLAMWTSVRQRI